MISIIVAFIILIAISFWDKFQFALNEWESFLAGAWLSGVRWYDCIWLIPCTLVLWLLYLTRIYRI